jgi:hypothetical protein
VKATNHAGGEGVASKKIVGEAGAEAYPSVSKEHKAEDKEQREERREQRAERSYPSVRAA